MAKVKPNGKNGSKAKACPKARPTAKDTNSTKKVMPKRNKGK